MYFANNFTHPGSRDVYGVKVETIREMVAQVQLTSTMYSRTSMARSLMGHSPGLARTVFMVSTGHFMANPPGWLELSLARTFFHGPKPVCAIEVLL